MRKILLLLIGVLISPVVMASDIRVTGRILDSSSQPLAGAMVLQSGTTNAAITNVNGNFALTVPSDGEIQVSYVGYKTAVENVAGRTNIELRLEQDAKTLQEVVVLGYGQAQKREDLSVAVSQKKIDEATKSRSTDIIGALQGQIAGVTITANGGDPLAKPTVTIRGMGSRDGNAPLYVVDGVAGAPFNGDDVETITVLKDAASAAIYGINVGSGGVILVTTKKAKQGAVSVSARLSSGFQSAWRKPEVLNAEEYVKVMSNAFKANGRDIPDAINPDKYAYGQKTRTNWIDEIFRTGLLQRYAVSLSGGTETVKAYASAEYGKTQGTLLNTWNENFGAKANIDFKITNWLSFSQRLSYKYTNGQGGVGTGHTGVLAAAMFMPPSATVYDEDKNGNPIYDANGNRVFGGTVPSWAKELGVAGSFGEIQNPVATLKRLNQHRPNQSLYSTSGISIRPFDGFKVTSDLTASTDNNRYEDFKARVTEIGKTNDENTRTLSFSRNNSFLWESVASYDKTLGRHEISAMAGYSMKYNRYNAMSVTMKNFASEGEYTQHFENGGSVKDRPTEAKTEEAMVSAFGRVAYSYGQRYFLTASIRRDASSKLYKDNNAGVFPAVSAAWKISSEEFLRNNNVISLLKLRASWGQIGSVDMVPNYSFASNLATGEPVFLGDNHQNPVYGLSTPTIPNLALGWERSEQTDFGFDMELFRGRVSFSADYFNKITKDLIERIPMASVSGVSEEPYGNIGKVQNRGVEFVLGYKDQTRSGWNFGVDANLTLLHSEVKDLGGRDFFYHNNIIRGMYPLRSIVGQPWYSYYLIESAGVFQTQAEIDAYTYNGKKIQDKAVPGDMKFIDRNNDGIINEKDSKYMGSYAPKFTYGLNAFVEYKGFDLSVALQGVGGNKIFNGIKVMTYEGIQGWNLSKDVLNSWTWDKNSGIPQITSKDTNKNFTTVSDFFLEDGDYVRLKNVTLGYTLPRNIFGQASRVPNIRVYASGENLLTLTKYSGMDPEVGNHGIDGGTYPVSRVISFGVNMSF